MTRDVKGVEPMGPPSWSTVNILFPLKVGSEPPTSMFALATWLLPRVPTIGEEIYVVGNPVPVEQVRWDVRGRATVRLREASIAPETLEALEQEGWEVAPWEDEPPSTWFSES